VAEKTFVFVPVASWLPFSEIKTTVLPLDVPAIRKRPRLLSVAIGFSLLLAIGCQDRQSSTPAPSPVQRTESASETSRAEFVAILTPLVDPAKLDTLKGERAANPRLRKICYWMETLIEDCLAG
jgi:hypothetical protein